MRDGLAILEITALGAALVILDQIHKAAPVRLVQAELNDYYGFVLKIAGDVAALHTAAEVAEATAATLHAPCLVAVLDAPDDRAWPALETPREYQPLIEQYVVYPAAAPAHGDTTMTDAKASFAIGLIETHGFAAVLEAIDTACKAANVEVLGKEKLGGGYITILIQGDVAAVNAAIEAGKAKVPALGKLIAAHVIPRPSAAVLQLLGV